MRPRDTMYKAGRIRDKQRVMSSSDRNARFNAIQGDILIVAPLWLHPFCLSNISFIHACVRVSERLDQGEARRSSTVRMWVLHRRSRSVESWELIIHR